MSESVSESIPKVGSASIWVQPEPEDPTPFIVHAQELVRKRREEGLEPLLDSRSRMNAWHALDFDTRKSYERGRRQDRFEAAIAEFNANVPLSPSVSGESSGYDDVEPGGVTDRRAIQKWNRYRRDYKKGSSNGHMASLRAPFPFLKLPFDIRRLIYVLLVKRVRPVQQLATNGCINHPSGPIDLRVAVASKQLFAEAMRAFFEENTLLLDIQPVSTTGLPVLFSSKAVSAAYWPLESIKRITIFISYFSIEETNFISTELRKLCNIVGRCSLVQLQITTYCGVRWFSKDLNESFDKVLACLESLRGIRECSFTEDLDVHEKRGLSNYRFSILGTPEYKKRLQKIVTEPRETEKS